MSASGSGFSERPRAAAGVRRRLESLVSFFKSGLSTQLLWLTVVFVLIAEVVIYVPSIGTYWREVLTRRHAAAQIVALVDMSSQDTMDQETRRRLLENVDALAIMFKRSDRTELLLVAGEMPSPSITVDLARRNILLCIMEAFDSLFSVFGSEQRVIEIVGDPAWGKGEMVSVMVPEAGVRAELYRHSFNILLLSLIIAGLVAAGVYATLYIMVVGPMRRITLSMVNFRDMPEDQSRIIEPRLRGTELAVAEHELAAMQRDLRAALHQKKRLAELGTAVSKINHDLRNMLASSQLISERLVQIDDPTVRRLSPKLVAALDRAVKLCADTLKYGRVEEPSPRPEDVSLPALVEDVHSSLALSDDGRVVFANNVPRTFTVHADPEQLFRILLNLARNALQAIEAEGGRGDISIAAHEEGGVSVIEVTDTGPGIAPAARDQLFKAFMGSARDGGTGLGLAISAELVEAHGGRIELVKSDETGTRFRIELPNKPAGKPAAGNGK